MNKLFEFLSLDWLFKPTKEEINFAIDRELELFNLYHPPVIWQHCLTEDELKTWGPPRLPKYGTTLAAGFDICTYYPVSVPAGGKVVIATGLRAKIPDGYFVKIFSKSGLSLKADLEVGAGVIDPDFLGPKDEWKIILRNSSNKPHHFAAGDKITQGVLLPLIQGQHQWGKVEKGDSSRAGGFGSTGK